MKKILLVTALLCFSLPKAQIAITEVYYDTPFFERENVAYTKFNVPVSKGYIFQNAHKGEFIELFNYTKRTIDISDWYISDCDGTFTFPENTIMKPREFLVLAYSRKNYFFQNNSKQPPYHYFFDFFRTTGQTVKASGDYNVTLQQNTLLYQNELILDNYDECLTLYAPKWNGTDFTIDQPYEVSTVFWVAHKEKYNIPYERNKFDVKSINYETYDFYKKSLSTTLETITEQESLQSHTYKTATPFELGFEFKLIDFEQSGMYKDLVRDDYGNINHNGKIEEMLYAFCDPFIETLNEKTIYDSYDAEVCFQYDASGNQTAVESCAASSNQTKDEEEERIEYLSNRIFIYPVPTENELAIRWETELDGLISHISITSMYGGTTIPVVVDRNALQTTVDLSLYLDGIYIVTFDFVTGEHLSRKIIKH